MEFKDGTRLFLDSALLNDIASRTSAEEIKELLRKLVEDQAATPEPKILFICDRAACDDCNNIDCNHTTKITHAKNFEFNEAGFFVERARK